ncbi:xylose repressor [Halanaerocella petrolearia]
METQVKNSFLMRDLNLANIFKLIHKLGPISRKELAENTDYSSATISNHVKTLIKQDFVLETEKGSSTGGRKPVYLKTNPDKAYILSVDIEVNRVRVVLFNLDLKIAVKSIVPIIDKSDPNRTMERICNEINKIVDNRKLDWNSILGIGVAVPGLIDKESGCLKFAPNLTWTDVEITKLFKDKYDVPVILENEANAAAIGEKEFVYPEEDNLVYVSINAGIGCGIIFNNELYKGASGNAGEFGHIIIDRDGPKCHCGNNGCWETLASESYILQKISRANNLNELDIYKEDKQEFIEVFKETGKNIGIGVGNIINSLSPELVVIGGDVTEIKDYICDEILKVAKEETLTVSYEKTEIKFSQLGDATVVYGLASLIFNEKLIFSK